MKHFLFSVSFLLLVITGQAQKTYLQCGQLIDVRQLQVLKEKTIVIEGNKILDILDGYQSGVATDKVVNLKTSTVMPGLMDMHVHIENETNPNRYLEGFTQSQADIAYGSLRFAERDLMAGFTSVRDLGGSGANIAMRKAIQKGYVVGPRIFTAGKSIATTGGHADPTNNYRPDLMGDPGPKDGVINGPEDAYKAVRQRYKDGSDLIKITASGGVLSMATNGENPQFTEEEVKAIVAAAKDYGFKVAAHCHGVEAMKRAIRGGVNSIEHGTLMDESVFPLMVQYGTYLVPTIIAGKSAADSAKIPGYYPPMVAKKALEIGPKIQNTFSKAYKAGVKIAFGTDAGVYAHGTNWKEFVYMTEGGMPFLETIQAATWNAADLMGTQAILGSIEKNKLADIIAVEGDPTKNVYQMGKVNFVMKDGVVYKNTLK
ncbi:MAG: amidohydrolase family protein [Sediminibacterium sp.]|jgi:imidazolonepropionase-like amidohydrolase|nr:MAG: amidohydrolase family protein [Sediminibacterium sp.]